MIKPGNDISQLESYRVMTKEIEQQLVTMYNHDFTERTIDDEIMPQRSIEDQTFVKLAEESIKKINNNYEIGIPLRDMDQKFPNNRPLAEKRACHLKSKFGRNEEFHKEYTQAMSTNIDKGYAEEVPEEELLRDDGKIWYLHLLLGATNNNMKQPHTPLVE